jgi:thiamine transport system permease protein
VEGSDHRVSPYARFARTVLPAPVAFVALFVAIPTVVALRHGFDVTRVFTDRQLRDVMWFTTWQAAASTALTASIGLPIAWMLSRHEFTGRRAVRALILVPFVLPTVVVGLAFRALFPGELRTGIVPLIVAHAFLNVAVMVRVVGARWERQPFGFEEAAATLGANPLRRFATVTWPMLRGAIVAAAGLVFMYSFTTFGAARVLAGPTHPTTETEIYRLAVFTGDVRAAASLAVVQILFVGIVLATTSGRGSPGIAPAAPRSLRLAPRLTRILILTCTVVVAAFFALPLAGLVLRSLRAGGGFSLNAWRAAFSGDTSTAGAVSADAGSALIASLRVAGVAAFVATVVGVCLSFARVHATRARERSVAVVCEVLPVVVSAVVLGLGFILSFRNSPVDWRGTWWILPVAHAAVALPLVSRTLTSAMQQIPNGLRDAAATLGASPARTLVDIDIALLRRPIAAAASLAALVSLGEFGASSFLTRHGSETLTMTIGRLLGRPGDLVQSQVFVTASVLGLVCILLVWLVDALSARSRVR